MVISYAQKSAVYWSYVKAHPEKGVTAIYKNYEHTKYGMRKTDALNLVGKLKDAAKFVENTNASSLPKATKDKMNKGIYQSAKRQSKRYLKTHPLKLGEKRRSIKQTNKDTFGDIDKPNDYSEMY